jgi:hypothetical protein
MPKQLLIYEKAVPVTVKQHGDVSIKAGTDFSFAKEVNSVPLLASEFDLASGEYAIVFSGEGDDVMPAVLLGIRDHENLYVDDAGAWNASISRPSCAAIRSCSRLKTSTHSICASTKTLPA